MSILHLIMYRLFGYSLIKPAKKQDHKPSLPQLRDLTPEEFNMVSKHIHNQVKNKI